MSTSANFRYVALADDIQNSILKGVFLPGEKLPSLRKLHIQLGLSVSTIHQAYIELEKRGRIEAREKSGFYVKNLNSSPLKQPPTQKITQRPMRVTVNTLAQAIITDLQSDDILKLGAAIPSTELLPLKPLSRIAKSIRTDELHTLLSHYDHYEGNKDLREAIAKRMVEIGCSVEYEDIITTNGCLDAISLCLRSVAGPGDTILVESPVFHGFLQLIEDLNMYVIEIPGCPEQGMDPQAFENALATNPVKACLLNSNFQNPLGSVMSAQNKAAVLDIATTYKVPVIEDDIYGDLFFTHPRPSTFKSMDQTGNVLYCASFSKAMAPGLRIGWTIPGNYKEILTRLKLNTLLSTAGINQVIAARFLASGAFDRHLRQLRNRLKNQVSAMAIAVSTYFPPDTRITFPKGGMCLWIALNPKIDSLQVYQQAYQEKISILPGAICSTSGRYHNCLRLNCGVKWDRSVEKGIQTLGQIITRMMTQK